MLKKPAWMGAVSKEETYFQCPRCRAVTIYQKGMADPPKGCWKCGCPVDAGKEGEEEDA